MGKVLSCLRSLARTARWALAGKVLLALAVVVFAASITITPVQYQSTVGSAFVVSNSLLATDKGFSRTFSTVAATSCASPVTFGVTPGTANTAITAGDLIYDVQVNTTGSTGNGAKFNATIVLASTTFGPVCIQGANPNVSGQTIDCKFDVGTSLPSSPYSFKVTVQ